jgi:chromosome segregation ATPase
MNIEKVQEIKQKIADCEMESAKAKGVIETIEKDWLAEYGTSEIVEIKKKLDDLENQQKATEERMDELYNELLESYDWESV